MCSRLRRRRLKSRSSFRGTLNLLTSCSFVANQFNFRQDFLHFRAGFLDAGADFTQKLSRREGSLAREN